MAEESAGASGIKKGALDINLIGTIENSTLLALINYLEDAERIFKGKTAGAAKRRRLKITITICSSGGDSTAGVAIYDRIRSSGLPVRTRALGEVSSAALAVFLAGKERLMFENAFLASDKTNQKTNDRSRQEKEITLTQLQREDERYSCIILENSRMTKRQLDKFEREEKQINAQEAVKLGLAHKIIRNI